MKTQFLLEKAMQRNSREDRTKTVFANNLRLRSKLTLILKRKTGRTGKLVNKETEGIDGEAKEVKECKWVKPRFINIGTTFHGLSAIDQKQLQQKSGTFCSLHQILELKSAQMSNSYRKESERICFDPIDVQLRRLAVQELTSKVSLASDVSRSHRLAITDFKDRAFRSFSDRAKFFTNDLVTTWGPLMRSEAGWNTHRYHGSIQSLSRTSKTSSLPTIITNSSKEKEAENKLMISVL